ncbi:MAG: M3 family oligoendopeptidase, partial [Planctomycetota bacterium]
MTFRFDELETEPVSQEEVDRVYADLHARLDVCPDVRGAVAIVESWDQFRRKLDTWGALAHIRFTQDTTDEARRQKRDEYDERAPKLTEAAIEFQRKLLDSPHRPALERELGEYVFRLWECSILTYDPAIEAETIEESKLSSRYDEILGSAEIEFRGENYNLSGLGKFFEDSDRDTRHEAEQARWNWFASKGDELDDVFDKLVKLRHAKAKKLGFKSYTELAYKGLSRTDYDESDVARYRDAVRTHVVPIGTKIRTAQANQLGVDPLMFWDEAVADPQGNPAPHAEHDALVEAGQRMFDEIGHGLDDFFRMMIDSRLTDLGARKGKAVGGYCSDIATERVPFIYANFNGTKGDVEVFTHEMGHAFQCYEAREAFPMDLWWPTAEAAEIHSMSLEFLTWPQMEHFFDGDGADRFRRIHLTESLLFLPYGVAVDHFQHLVYAEPEASP